MENEVYKYRSAPKFKLPLPFTPKVTSLTFTSKVTSLCLLTCFREHVPQETFHRCTNVSCSVYNRVSLSACSCAMYTMYTIQCIQYNVYNVYNTMYTMYRILYNVQLVGTWLMLQVSNKISKAGKYPTIKYNKVHVFCNHYDKDVVPA